MSYNDGSNSTFPAKRKKISDRIKRSKQSYAGLEEEYDEDGNPMKRTLLEKYDFEDNVNDHKHAYVLNESGGVKGVKQGKILFVSKTSVG